CNLDQLPQESDSFIEAGLDSLAMVSLTSQLQVEVGMHHELPPTLLFDYPRISDMTDYLVALLQPKPNQSFNNRVSLAKPGSNLPTQTTNQTLRSAVQALSEEDALAELMKELE
ncbi:MAG: acyl carrier protein, partial [Planctomycetota bacterium]